MGASAEMTTPDLVSVVITCYNQAPFLAEAIGSVLAQTYPHYEITVVDDDSQDNPGEVAARYPQINYVWQKNQDVSAARNTGLGHSHGEFQVFIDADDRFLPHAFERGVALLKAHPECGFVTGRHVYIDAEGKRMPTLQERRRVERDHYYELLRANFIGCPASVMFRRAVFETVRGFDTKFNHSGDYDLYLRVAREFPILCYEEAVVEYRKHGANNSLKLEMMWEYISAVLHAQLELVKGDERCEAACLQGIEFYEGVFASEQLVEQIRAHARARRWRSAALGALTLLRNHPQVFGAHAGRKVRRVVRSGRKSSSLL
jgi:glycosyltransferase involved in cell wall biosynthesis